MSEYLHKRAPYKYDKWTKKGEMCTSKYAKMFGDATLKLKSTLNLQIECWKVQHIRLEQAHVKRDRKNRDGLLLQHSENNISIVTSLFAMENPKYIL